ETCEANLVHGLTVLREDAARRNETASVSTPAPSAPPKANGLDVDASSFFRSGDGWRIRFQGKEAFIKDSTGVQYIQELLRHAHVPVPAVQLAGVEGADAPQEVADPETLADINRRLRELNEEIAEAEDNSDEGQLHDLRLQRSDLLAEVTKATYRGRARALKSP